jgi:hypothetical protein
MRISTWLRASRENLAGDRRNLLRGSCLPFEISSREDTVPSSFSWISFHVLLAVFQTALRREVIREHVTALVPAPIQRKAGAIFESDGLGLFLVDEARTIALSKAIHDDS